MSSPESRKKKRNSEESAKVHKKKRNEQETLKDQLKDIIEKELVEYIKNSPFERITDKLGPVKYTGLGSLMLEDILAMSTPYYGVNYAIKTMFDMLDMIALETATIIARDFDCAKDLKTNTRSLHVVYQRVPIPKTDFEQIKDSTDVAAGVEPWIRELVYYDRETNFIDEYKKRGVPLINIVTIKLGSNTTTTTTTTTTTKPLLNVLMPFVVRHYTPSLVDDKYLVNYATLLEAFNKNEKLLTALKRKENK